MQVHEKLRQEYQESMMVKLLRSVASGGAMTTPSLLMPFVVAVTSGGPDAADAAEQLGELLKTSLRQCSSQHVQSVGSVVAAIEHLYRCVRQDQPLLQPPGKGVKQSEALASLVASTAPAPGTAAAMPALTGHEAAEANASAQMVSGSSTNGVGLSGSASQTPPADLTAGAAAPAAPNTSQEGGQAASGVHSDPSAMTMSPAHVQPLPTAPLRPSGSLPDATLLLARGRLYSALGGQLTVRARHYCMNNLG
jgi:hypothetical protein